MLRRGLSAVLIAASLVLAGWAARAAVPGGFPPLFGSAEVRADTISLFPKWQGAVGRFFDENRLAEAPCESTIFNRCHMREWLSFLDGLRNRDRAAQIEAVNGYMNRKRYVVDPVNWGLSDYWASPLQFMTRNGDCEDYAIAKYFSLRWLGLPASAMRIVVLHDMNLRVAHAILVVYDDDRALVLDNQVRGVVEAAAIRHYRPIYSINEHHWWLHRM